MLWCSATSVEVETVFMTPSKGRTFLSGQHIEEVIGNNMFQCNERVFRDVSSHCLCKIGCYSGLLRLANLGLLQRKPGMESAQKYKNRKI